MLTEVRRINDTSTISLKLKKKEKKTLYKRDKIWKICCAESTPWMEIVLHSNQNKWDLFTTTRSAFQSWIRYSDFKVLSNLTCFFLQEKFCLVLIPFVYMIEFAHVILIKFIITVKTLLYNFNVLNMKIYIILYNHGSNHISYYNIK